MNAHLLECMIWQGFIGSFFASSGFGVLFNVRGKALFAAGLTGALGGMVYKGCKCIGMEESVSNFMAAIVLSIFAEIFARKLKTTVSTFSACALIPLVPGGTAYEMMVEFSSGKPMMGIMKALDVVSISGMLALGMLTVSTLTRFFFYTRKKIRGTRKLISQQPMFKAAWKGKKAKKAAAKQPEQIEIYPVDASTVKKKKQKTKKMPDPDGSAAPDIQAADNRSPEQDHDNTHE